jgi:NADH dehydrogenase FAD-containing subunit
MRIVVLGGGFGGVATVRHLERVLRRRKDAEITLVSRENFFVLTPLLFEACSGRLELRHCAQLIRAALQHARFIEATVESVDCLDSSFEPLLLTAVRTVCRSTIWWSRSARRPTMD